ncbi:MAG TPA: uroporphyrinogen decarboxylase family protein [Clostridia bacterium]|nr:uroporphyrinogen decarboxylase family protein [Clostridia bacterium]
MLDLDIKQFWADDVKAHENRCFSKQAPQVALGIRMSEECVFAELGEEGNPWGDTPRERRMELNKRYNEKARKIVGQDLLREYIPPQTENFPAYRRIGEVFDGEYLFDGNSEWLKGNCENPTALEKLLDRIDKLDLRSFILPSNWESEKKRLYEKHGKKPSAFNSVRGPVTLATSVYGVENLIFLIYDHPELAKRFSDTIAKVLLGYIEIFIEESGQTQGNFQHGFWFADDNCCLLTAEMYELSGLPILQKIFEKTSPLPGDVRYQHSDSAMGHLLPLLAQTGLNGVNFGPTVMISDIRKHMKNATIDGQLAPFTFMNNDEEQIITEVKRDCAMARVDDIRGVNLTTAGSINNGSLLTSMRTVMAAIQNYGRY